MWRAKGAWISLWSNVILVLLSLSVSGQNRLSVRWEASSLTWDSLTSDMFWALKEDVWSL